MKKSNIIVFSVLVVVSAFLLWLWFFLGLNHVDEPLDLVLSIVWWAVVAAAIIVTAQVEKRRRERIRAVYVSDGLVFNTELGSLSVGNPEETVPTMSRMLQSLHYSFKKHDLPNTNAFPVRYLVRSSTYKDGTWEGEVVDVASNKTTSFANEGDLERALATV